MHKYGIAARGKRKKYVYRGLAAEIAPNKLREEAFKWINCDVYFRREEAGQTCYTTLIDTPLRHSSVEVGDGQWTKHEQVKKSIYANGTATCDG